MYTVRMPLDLNPYNNIRVRISNRIVSYRIEKMYTTSSAKRERETSRRAGAARRVQAGKVARVSRNMCRSGRWWSRRRRIRSFNSWWRTGRRWVLSLAIPIVLDIRRGRPVSVCSPRARQRRRVLALVSLPCRNRCERRRRGHRGSRWRAEWASAVLDAMREAIVVGREGGQVGGGCGFGEGSSPPLDAAAEDEEQGDCCGSESVRVVRRDDEW
ncbi:hypothetical protein C8F01DRAFT_1140751 [Mycena amicta]|nr:hypothetical protein C8F01DRAFT_1140751 [Mycena amicta]